MGTGILLASKPPRHAENSDPGVDNPATLIEIEEQAPVEELVTHRDPET